MRNLPALPRRFLPPGNRSLNLSCVAVSVLDYLMLLMRAQDQFPYLLTRSNVIEWLVHQALDGKLEDFTPRTAPAGRRPYALMGTQERIRPSHVRRKGEKQAKVIKEAQEELEEIARELAEQIERDGMTS